MWRDDPTPREEPWLTRTEPRARNAAMPSPPSSQTPGTTMRDFMAITKALADENRVRMLLSLRGGELCLCQIVELISLAVSTTSKHMSILRQSRLVEGRKQGRWMYYRWAGPEAPPAVRRALQWMEESLADDPQVLRDAQRLQQILKIDPEELCASGCPPTGSCGRPSRLAAAERR
jgi:ArsR family transcriptional regulator, arsenate/arsenite/antimonite-responsive transcriptional repressor